LNFVLRQNFWFHFRLNGLWNLSFIAWFWMESSKHFCG
jgi:hypothetical protein